MPDAEPVVPKPLKKKVHRFCNKLHAALGENLESIVLYGGLAKGDEYHPRSSDVNVMLVLTEVNVDALDSIATPIRRARKAFRLSPMILSERDLASSTDVFPIKFLDIKHHHRILFGKNLLKDLAIDDEHLRLRCEQEIKNHLFRLRSQYLNRTPHTRQLRDALISSISPLLHTFNVLLFLETSRSPVLKGETIQSLEKDLGLDGESLKQILAMKRGEYRPRAAQIRSLFDNLIASVEKAANLADGL